MDKKYKKLMFAVLIAAGLYVLSPIDLLPINPIDDIIGIVAAGGAEAVIASLGLVAAHNGMKNKKAVEDNEFFKSLGENGQADPTI